MSKKIIYALLCTLFLIAPVIAQSGAILDTEDEYWIYMEGPEANETLGKDYPNVLEGPTEYEESCWFNGTIYREGEIKDMGEKIQDSDDKAVTFESGGWHPDREICLNIPGRGDDVDSGTKRESDNYRGGDKGGEWWDQDQWIVTRYLRSNGGSVHSDAWQELWVEQPDEAADPSTGVIPGEGIALEDDCAPGYSCEDFRTGTGRQGPYAASFVEGALDDDNALDVDTSFSIKSLSMFHNRVQADGGTGHPYGSQGPGNAQDQENPATENLDEMPLQNSHIDPADDEWALTPELSWVIANDGTSYSPNNCYGDERVQGVDKSKIQAVYANSFANSSGVYDQGKSDKEFFSDYMEETAAIAAARDGNWINPDHSNKSVLLGETSCDLTGKDWGYAYKERPPCGLNEEPEASFTAYGSGVTVYVTSLAEDEDGEIERYEWDWTDDGTYEGRGASTSHTYNSGGTKTIEHRIFDDCGANDTATQQVTLEPPVKEGGGEVSEVNFFWDIEGSASLIPREDGFGNFEDICLGADCPHSTGQGPTDYDTDDRFVDISGDKMSGTLKTEVVSPFSGNNLCIGSGCAWNDGSDNGHLGESNTYMDGPIATKGITTDEDLCLGSEC